MIGFRPTLVSLLKRPSFEFFISLLRRLYSFCTCVKVMKILCGISLFVCPINYLCERKFEHSFSLKQKFKSWKFYFRTSRGSQCLISLNFNFIHSHLWNLLQLSIVLLIGFLHVFKKSNCFFQCNLLLCKLIHQTTNFNSYFMHQYSWTGNSFDYLFIWCLM